MLGLVLGGRELEFEDVVGADADAVHARGALVLAVLVADRLDRPAGALGQARSFSYGYCTVIGPRIMLRIVMRSPLRSPVPHMG